MRRVEHKDLGGGLRQSRPELIRVETPVVVAKGQRDAEHFASSELGVVQIEREHGFEADNLVTFITKSADESHQSPVGALRNKHFIHWVDIFSELRTIYFSDFIAEDGDAESARVLIMTSIHGFNHIIDQELRRHGVRSSLT